ncbi:Atp5f1 [Columba guinea]|nr:Atp5f1 [Columba guinea]
MLSRLVLRAAPAALRSLAPPATVGVLHVTRPLHTTQQRSAPLPPLPEKGGEVRHGLIPEEFFQFLYPKTGVTGPYMLGTGLLLYLLSKEIYVINHETVAAACILTVIIYGVKKYGADVAAFADKLNENNIAMLLETNYRERLLTVYNEVKKRLDYQVAMQNLKRQKEQDHMIQWVEKNVVQSITPQQTTVHTMVSTTVADMKPPEVKCWIDNHEILYMSLAFISGILSAVLAFAIIHLCRKKCRRPHQTLQEELPTQTVTEESEKNRQSWQFLQELFEKISHYSSKCAAAERFPLEVLVLVSSIKTNFDNGNLQGKVPMYGKVQYKLSSSRRVGGSDLWVKRCFEGCTDSSGL